MKAEMKIRFSGSKTSTLNMMRSVLRTNTKIIRFKLKTLTYFRVFNSRK